MLSMFMILIIHANMVSLARPSSMDLSNNPLAVITRYFFESIGIVSVDVFVMISGWFLVKTRTKSVLSFLYQIFFFWGGGYLIMLLTGNAELSVKGLLTCFSFTSWDWFIKAYLVLFIISPILNTFIQSTSEKVMRNVIIWFFVFMCTYGWIGGASRFFVGGYGPLSFIGLYLLSNYAHNAKDNIDVPIFIKRLFCFDKYVDLSIFLTTVVLNTIVGIFALKWGIDIYSLIYAYINPLVIIGALYFLLFFSKLEIKQSSIINWLAASSFSVYLLHSQIDIRPFFTEHIQNIYEMHNGISVVGLIALYLVIVYIFSVLIDQIRIITWNHLSKNIK